MKLKSIELNGFKSFQSKSIFKIDSNLIGIVGPNGSGKSNIIDAIRWVLGEQSAKNLRGGSMKDVIFSGTEEVRGKNFAEVSLTFFESDEEKTITRRLYKNGDSEYLVNGKQSKLKELTDIYFDLGINKESYSIITQGKVESILSTKPQDRRVIIEEAAGVLKYKNKKKEANLKLEKTEDNIQRLNDIFSEIKERYNALSEQKELTEKYIKYNEELRKKDIILKSLDAKTYKLELENLNEELNLYSKKIINLEKEIVVLENNIKNTKTSLVNIDNDYFVKKEEEIHLIKELERLNSSLTLYKERNLNKNNSLIKIKNEKIELSKRENSIEEKINNYKVEISELKTDFKKIESKLKIYNKNSKISINDLENNIENLKDEYFRLTNLEGKLQNDLLLSKKIKQNNNQSIDNINNEIISIETQIYEENKILENIIYNLETRNKDLSIITNDFKNKKYEKEKKLESREELLLKIFKGKDLLANFKHKKDFLESQINSLNNYNIGVKTILENKKNILGIHATVGDVLIFDKQFTVALDTALSSTQQNIIVDNEEVARKCVEYLKNNSKGRATFLPINNIKKREINHQVYSKISKEIGFINLASDLLTYDLKYNNIISYLLGLVIVVDNLSNGNRIAKNIDYKYKIVTLDGQVINSGGSITGGAGLKNTNSIVKNKADLEELNGNIFQIENKIKMLNRDLEIFDKELIESSKKLESDSDKISKIEIDITELELKRKLSVDIVNKLKLSLSNEKFKLKEFSDVNNGLKAEKVIDNEIKEIKENLLVINNKLNEETNKKLLLTRKKEETQIVINNLNIEKSKIIESLKNKEEVLIDLKSDLKYIKLQITKLDDEQSALENNKLISEEEYKVKINELQENLNFIFSELKNIKIKKDKLYQEDNKLNQKYKNKYNERQDYNKNLENINLKITKLEVKLDEIVEYLLNTYNITYEKSEELLVNVSVQDISTYKEDVRNIKIKLSELGNVNMNAIEEFNEIFDRYNFYNTEISDLITSKEKLKSTIKEIDKEVEERFLDTFSKIANNFKKIYQVLFNGGNANISLEDNNNILETGINIEASPPGKKLQNLALLSGGEKALTAISLLFAILEIKQPPFVILDEVEAALDDNNIVRFAKFLKLYSKENQFLVITHRRGTMEVMDKLYGITMQEKGVSYLLPLDLNKILEEEYIGE